MKLLSEAAQVHAASLLRAVTPPRRDVPRPPADLQPSSSGAAARAETPLAAGAAASSREAYGAAAATTLAIPTAAAAAPSGGAAAPADAWSGYVPVSDIREQHSVHVDADGSVSDIRLRRSVNVAADGSRIISALRTTTYRPSRAALRRRTGC